jgi:hypothetical protein
MWSIADLADAVEAGVKATSAQLDEEHAIYGLDAKDEVELHPILAEAFTRAEYGVHREHRYPADQKKRRESEGERCDLVLTPDGRELASGERKATLFEPADAVPLDEAYWLEVKTVAQYTIEGANGQYSSQLLSTIGRDVTKLSKDRGILHAGLLIVMFVQDERIANHDLGIWQDRCLKRNLPIAAPSQRCVPITDRLGNGCCVLALYPVRHW